MNGLTDEERKLARRVKALRDWCDTEYEKQLKKGQLEVTNLWNETDGDGDEVEQSKGQRGGASYWKLMALPREEDLFDAAGNAKWLPKYVRLTDDAAIVSLCIHDKVYRATFLPWDFDTKGEIRKIRVPIGPTILIMQNGLRSLPTWNDWYVFTGGNNSAGWLLEKRSNTTNRFQGGYVLAGKDSVYNLTVTLQSYQPIPSIRPVQRWVAYAYDNRIFFEGNQRSESLIITPTDQTNEGMITTLAQQTHFHTRICENANEFDPHQHSLKRSGQTEEQHNAAVNTEWTEENDETPRVGKSFKWDEIDSQKPLRRKRTAAPAPKRRRLAKTLVASPSAASTASPTMALTPEPITTNPRQEPEAVRESHATTKPQTKDAATMTEHGMGTISTESIPNPEIQVLDTIQSLGTLQSFYNLARLEAGRSFPTLMTAASRIEALAASCGNSKKAHAFLRTAGEHKMTPTEAEALFEKTTQPTLPPYLNTTLSNIANIKEAAEIRDALRFTQSLAAFKTALEEQQQSDPTVAIFKNLYKEWAKLLPARHKTVPDIPTFQIRTSTPDISTSAASKAPDADPTHPNRPSN